MALDLLKTDYFGDWDPPYSCVDAGYLVALLCAEARVCLSSDTEARSFSNQMDVRGATYDVQNGLRVTDKDGVTYRLRVVAELVEGTDEPA